MKIGAVSGDLVVKLAIGAGVLALAWYALNKAREALPGLADAATTAINPASDQNLAYKAANAAVQAATSGQESTFGGWLARMTGADRDAEIRAMLKGTAPAAHDEAMTYGTGHSFGLGA